MSALTERLTYHVGREMPRDWIMHKPLVFEGNRPGLFIARISGGLSDFHPAARRVLNHYEIEGYGASEEAALEDLLTKLDRSYLDRPHGGPSEANASAAILDPEATGTEEGK